VDDLVQLVFFGLLILFGLMSGRRKKKTPPVQSRARPRTPPASTIRPERASVPPRRVALPESAEAVQRGSVSPVRAEPPPRPRDLAQDLFDLLQGRAPVPTGEPRQAVAAAEPEEAVSLEVIEPDTQERHQKFHDRYIGRPAAEERSAPKVFSKAQLELSKRGLRQAFVMKEVLGPPKGLEG